MKKNKLVHARFTKGGRPFNPVTLEVGAAGTNIMHQVVFWDVTWGWAQAMAKVTSSNVKLESA